MLAPPVEDLRLLVRLVRRDEEGAARAAAARRAPLESAVDTAMASGLGVPLAEALRDSPLRPAITPAHLEALEARAARQRERSRRLLETLPAVAARFGAAGQEFILLKGPYLAARFYGDALAREYVDLDVAVRRADREPAFRLLRSAGYQPRSGVLLSTRLTCFFVHGFDFAGEGGKLDLHWCLARHPSLRLDEGRIWRQRQTWTYGGNTVAVLSDADEIVFAALSLMRDFERGRPKAKNVVDLVQIAAALDSTFDWDALLARSRDERCHGLLVNILALCLEVADAGDLCPQLSASLSRHASRRVPIPPGEPTLALPPTAFAAGNKLWSARAHDTSVAAWALWWAASLPFRLATHRSARAPRR